MRDGVVLRADIYRPETAAKLPVILLRTPYDKSTYGEFVGFRSAAHGYVVIIQDVRGRHTSEGEWYPFKYESLDGYDTVEWAAALPYANGKVGMFGASYVGATQLLAAVAQPPHLAGIFPLITASNYHEGWTYQGGAFEQWFNEYWTNYLAMDTLGRRIDGNPHALKWIWKLPLLNYPVVDPGQAESLAPYFRDWLQHPGFDDYWKEWSIEDRYEKILVPAYHLSGWYDIFLGGTIHNYMGIKSRGGNAAGRRGQRLMLGPWQHDDPFAGEVGEVNFGSQADFDPVPEMLQWYDHLFKAVTNDIPRRKPVQIFVMGRNVWRQEDDWPLPRAKNTHFYLHSAGKANSLRGDGTLSAPTPQAESADIYVYDPADPVPTRGGGLCCDNAHLAAGPFDQRPNEVRDDVLVYSTPPFKEDFEVTGPISVELFASSTAVDTDFTAKLVDVWPNGFAQNLTDGIIRARYRESSERPVFMNPGEVYKFAIALWGTSNVFLKGHRLRLEVSSSNFPRFDRNLNTGEDAARAERFVKATNTVYHDASHPSAVVLPIVPQEQH